MGKRKSEDFRDFFLDCLNAILFAQIQQLSKKEIEDLLRRGAYGAIMDEEDEGSKFCEEDIDQILQRRTKTITIESEGRGSTFAKVHSSRVFCDSEELWMMKMLVDVDVVELRPYFYVMFTCV